VQRRSTRRTTGDSPTGSTDGTRTRGRVTAETDHPPTAFLRAIADSDAVCVPLRTAIDAVLAVERDGEPLPAARAPRFVAPVDVGRTVKGVRELRFLRLAPGEDVQEYEDLGY